MTALIRRVVTVDWPKVVERDAKALLIRTARNGHKKIMDDARGRGLSPSWDAYANTPGNKDLASVKLPGPIVYNYRYLTDVIQFALDELRRQSPVQSGDYVRSHTLYVNGAPVDVIPKTLNAGDRLFISNPVPYARKLEIGKTKAGRAFVVQVPNRIYERVTDLVKARVRGAAKVRFGYASLGASARDRRNPGRRLSDGRAPAIFIEPLI